MKARDLWSRWACVLVVLLCAAHPFKVLSQQAPLEFSIQSGNTLQYSQLQGLYPPGEVTIIIDFATQGDNRVRPDWLAPRSGHPQLMDRVLETVRTWRYPNGLNRGIAKLTVNVPNRSLKFDLTDLAKFYAPNSIRFPDIETEKKRYLRYHGFKDDRVNILLAPRFIREHEKAMVAIQKLWDRLKPSFFIIFLILAVVMFFVIACYLGSKWVVISELVIAVFIWWPLNCTDKLSLAFYIPFWAGVIAIGIFYWLKKKAILSPVQLEGDKKTIEKVQQEWKSAIRDAKGPRVCWKDVEQRLNNCITSLSSSTSPSLRPKWPMARILFDGICNHLSNKLNWYCSQEIDRAIDRAIDSEVEKLRGKGLDALWSLASIAPMLGLLGTVVGIARAFGKIRGAAGLRHEEIIPRLSGDINVALYTTIVGLIIGIISLGLYYLIRWKIEKIRTSWESKLLEIINPY